MHYDAILFDLDGTLTDSEPGIINCVKYALASMERPPLAPEVLRGFIGPPLKHAFQEFAGLDEQEAARALALYRERFRQIGWLENAVYPGIAPLLRTLKARGAYLAMATAKPLEFARRIAAHFGLDQYLDHIEGVSLSEHNADKRAIVAAALPARFRRACMVGDRSYDMAGAKDNGIEAIGALYGYGSEAELLAAGADQIARNVDELAALLLAGLPRAQGLFISLEGPDGCGKSTQAARLAQFLTQAGWPVRRTREPGGCPIAEAIRAVVLDANQAEMSPVCEALLFAAARAQHVAQIIRPALARGEIVLCERFVDSSVAYQGMGRGLGMAQVRAINAPAVDGCMPDLTIFFDMDPRTAMARRAASGGLDRIEREEMDFVERVYAGYQEIMRQDARRFCRVRADAAPDDVFAAARDCVLTALRA